MALAQFHWDPDSYLALMRQEMPDYDILQEQTAAATGTAARRILELGTGSGETARRVLAANPAAVLIGVDTSKEMLARARALLPPDRTELRVGRLEDPLPAGPFDAVVSALAVHHLNGEAKADLFGRVAAVLAPGGRFVLADVIVPEDPADAITPLDPSYDTPSRIADQERWLKATGLQTHTAWAHRDLAVLVGTAPGSDRGHPS